MSSIFQCSSSLIVKDLNDSECCSDKKSLKQECNSFELNIECSYFMLIDK